MLEIFSDWHPISLCPKQGNGWWAFLLLFLTQLFVISIKHPRPLFFFFFLILRFFEFLKSFIPDIQWMRRSPFFAQPNRYMSRKKLFWKVVDDWICRLGSPFFVITRNWLWKGQRAWFYILNLWNYIDDSNSAIK